MFKQPHHPHHPDSRHRRQHSGLVFCRNPFRILVSSPSKSPVKGAEITFFDESGRVKHKAYTNAGGIAQVNIAADRNYTVIQTKTAHGFRVERRCFHLCVTKDCRFIIDGKQVKCLTLINEGAPKECRNCLNAV